MPPTPGATKVPLFNLEPEFGEPARFGFKVGAPGYKKTVILETAVAWESDYHESFTINLPDTDRRHAELEKPPGELRPLG